MLNAPLSRAVMWRGDTYEETISEIRQVITGFIEEYKKSEEEIPIDNYSIACVRVPV
jgi:predicted RNase H-like HicB family nuclease